MSKIVAPEKPYFEQKATPASPSEGWEQAGRKTKDEHCRDRAQPFLPT